MTEKQIDRWISDTPSDLTMWQAWNDAMHSGNKAIETPDGEQFMVLWSDFIMQSKPTDRGWDIKVMTGQVFMESYVGFCDTKKWKLVTPRELE